MIKRFLTRQLGKIIRSILGRKRTEKLNTIVEYKEYNSFLIDIIECKERCIFLLNELEHSNIALRHLYRLHPEISLLDSSQTKSSFDYQWKNFHNGIAMPNDNEFMAGLTDRICQYTGFDHAWFPGKKVIDLGSGCGRYSYGLLKLGASVVSCDQSAWALERTAALCKEFKERHQTRKIDLLKESEQESFDLAFCFGVAHHTGNTYLAIENVTKKISPGGRIFLMLYGYPNNLEGLREHNRYEELRHMTSESSFDEKKQIVIEKYGEHIGHGMFDAISPKINELLSFEEIKNLLESLNFTNVRRTIDHRNHHVIADLIL